MKTFEVFDPPLCCSTGVCGPSVDPKLIRFAADFHWLAGQGFKVERYNLAQQPQAFAANRAVMDALTKHGNACLPLILLNDQIVSQGAYPTRAELAKLAGVEVSGPELPVIRSGCCG
ncbi:MAG: arsenite efflux transporter metallochaperone ArsD [Verrucomicrobia bacterium]|nr:arsenite efflux transporter metallochaperone ArsD [Verrucomicrobiota bacterium]